MRENKEEKLKKEREEIGRRKRNKREEMRKK